ncbi:orotate phosphoribosyltransferase [Salinicoccus halodurans]|uniref:Orotate phosphoribosyltransferase n=1 Tax=Salinicoccus halodurans TaxID=407035 RepID=A0A0F7D471_9STAP|nr:orotate phosphoribosyltransferase [Salinicoccus halodurans]AKG73725.1 orotate phosphoribosyltransferase [Salinicoccus halodurans]SFK54883.1 orotate phosphoribosyltransferase [Salinicoccus halodurans]
MKERIAEILLDINAVELRPDEPFTWSSGIISPIYCDNRKVIGDVDARAVIADAFTEMIRMYAPEAEVIAGTSTAGIPHAAYISERMNLPMCYVRGSKKKHGKGNQIEGADVAGKKVVVIEDLISTGGSSLEAAETLSENGAEVLNIIAIFTYGIEKADQAFDRAGLTYHTLSDLDALLDVSTKKRKLNDAQRETVINFKNNL